ncbi:MAG: hypothetical protein R3C28_26405 [Pirellulaceae bacterium]
MALRTIIRQRENARRNLHLELLETRQLLTSDVYAHWPFDDNNGDNIADDVSGNNHNGTIHEAVFTSGQSGLALEFDGVNDYVDLGGLDVTGAGLTLAAWFKADSVLRSQSRQPNGQTTGTARITIDVEYHSPRAATRSFACG